METSRGGARGCDADIKKLPKRTSSLVAARRCDASGDLIKLPALAPGADVRAAGCDWAAGDELAAAGRPLTAADVAILAASGRESVDAVRRPRVRVFSSGEEVWTPAKGPFDASKHVRDANRAGLAALLAPHAEVSDGGVLPDDFEAWIDALRDAVRACDVVVTTGGASVGRADHAKAALEAAARGRVAFGRLHMKPGKPTTFATLDANSYARPSWNLARRP